MDLEDEEDIYAPEETISEGQTARSTNDGTLGAPVSGTTGKDGDEEEGEEVEEDESDSVG